MPVLMAFGGVAVFFRPISKKSHTVSPSKDSNKGTYNMAGTVAFNIYVASSPERVLSR